MRQISYISSLFFLLGTSNGFSQTENDSTTPSSTSRLVEEILVTGGADAIRTLPGSATLVDEEAIANFDITDVNAVLAQVPGVYIRQEDGYGLRPNIGIRGATSERSQKITLMEDGMLIAPAPYSAPAAYYLPNVNRMSAVEVFKGPASIQYGPHTVGGAVNLVTPAIPRQREGLFNLSYGSDNYYKTRLFYGDQAEQWGYWVDALRYGADGFKQLDSGEDTGFVRNDLNTKIQWRSKDDAAFSQVVQLKLGYADEDSSETYLGLTDEDFARDPQRRYAASEEDHFTSEHTQAHLLHSADFHNGWQVFNKAYINRFDRSWNKFDGLFPTQEQYLQGGYAARVSADMIFDNAYSDPQRLALIRGDINSDGSLEQTLDITDNAREYGSHGLESTGVYKFATGDIVHELTSGIRYHHDYVERDHSVRGYWMVDKQLLWDENNDYVNKALNRAQTDAIAVYVNDEVSWDKWIVSLGVRGEWIEGELDDDLNQSYTSNSAQMFMPGIGVFYQWSEALGLLAGVNKGFSPNSPGAADSVDPEESLNYEYGVRYQGNRLRVDAIGFFSDYQNLLGRCRVSDSGCEAGEEFNGGNVEVAGLELNVGYDLSISGVWFVPVALVYTYTETAFQEGFASSFSQWGDVRKGDELPYTPEHQAQLLIGVERGAWALNMGIKHVGEMRENPGRAEPLPDDYTQAYTTADVSFQYHWREQWKFQLVAENVANEQVIVARKPFGARPNAPRILKAGVTFEF